MAKEYECERDGVIIRAAYDRELVAKVQRHLAEAHPDLVGKVTGEDILAAAAEGQGPKTQTGDGLMLRLKRTLPAPREAVYRALSDPDELAKWWGPRGFTAPSVDFDPRVGDRYRIAMQPPEGELFHLSGQFREAEPPARLSYTFRWDPPDPADRETLVTLALQDRGERTEVVLTQSGFATDERRALHVAGWTESFDRLERVLGEASRSARAGSRVRTVEGSAEG